jgi:hypothetical protein
MEPDPVLQALLVHITASNERIALMVYRQQWLLVGQTAMLTLALLVCLAKMF